MFLRAVQLQSALVKVLYKPLDDMAEGLEEPKNMAVTFKKDIRFASKIGAYHFWPFAPVPDNEDSTIIFQHDVPHLLRKAYHAERLPQFLPLLHSLFAKLPPCSVPHSPHLLDTLHTLADLKCDSKTPDSCKQQLEVMLAVWQQPLQQAVAPKPVAVSTTSALNSSAVSGNVQQQHGFGSPESAVQSTADTAIPEEKICSVGEVSIPTSSSFWLDGACM